MGTLIVLFIMASTVVWNLCQKYNTAAQNAISNCSIPVVDSLLENENDDEKFRKSADTIVRNFEHKDKIELWVLDKDGTVVSTSSGFGVVENKSNWTDYKNALKEESGKAFCNLHTSHGEPVTAMSHIIRSNDGKTIGALRYIVSTEDLQKQLIVMLFVTIISFLIIILLIANSGAYFVSSIVDHVTEICVTTGEIAKGNFDVRLNNDYNDEIGELCNSINYMAKQLASIEKMKNEFISTVSHEIRTPLTAIKGWGETINNFSDNEELTKKGLEVIIDETNRLSSLVEQLLDFSSIQNNTICLMSEVVDVHAIIIKAIDIFEQKAQINKMNFLIENIDRVYVKGDSDRLINVFVNIIDNAIKYSGKEKELKINTEIDGDKIAIRFSDNGSGISEKDLPHVKEKFYKANTSVRGAGIGLSVCDEIIRLHSGNLNIYSKQEVGTTVEIVLPVAKKENT